MIEVEKKFTLSEAEIEKLTQGAEFVGEKIFTDTYFDSPDYKLTTRDKWLRLRGDRFELKLPMNEGKGASDRKLDQYEELDSDDEIRRVLGLKQQGTLREDLEVCGYKSFASFTTTRRKFKSGEFVIDLDVMDFGYSIGEIELMVSDESEMEQALDRILAFANKQGLVIAPVRAKVIEFINRNNADHYEALKKAGVL